MKNTNTSVCTDKYLSRLILKTVSNTFKISCCLLCRINRSIAMKVPVRPVPAEQCTSIGLL